MIGEVITVCKNRHKVSMQSLGRTRNSRHKDIKEITLVELLFLSV